MVSEISRLVAGTEKEPYARWDINLEFLRFCGLAAGAVLLGVGTFVTKTKVPPGLIDAGYISSTFHFWHTCVNLDYNPSRTIAGMIVMFQVFPLDLFIILSYYKIMNEYKSGKLAPDSMVAAVTPYITPVMLVFQTFFYMVFVNHPDANTFFVPSEEHPDSTDKSTWVTIGQGDLPYGFIFHYAPYMFWQAGMILMAIQQNMYLVETDRFGALGLSKSVLSVYNVFIICAGTVYCIFVWSFIFGHPLWDTANPVGKLAGQIAMTGFDVVVVGLPALFSLIECIKFPEDKFAVVFHDAK